jgi:hypothetical protein
MKIFNASAVAKAMTDENAQSSKAAEGLSLFPLFSVSLR